MYSARPISGGSVRETSVRTDSGMSKFTNWGFNFNFWAEQFTKAGAKRCGTTCHHDATTPSRSVRELRPRRDHRYHPLATGYGRP